MAGEILVTSACHRRKKLTRQDNLTMDVGYPELAEVAVTLEGLARERGDYGHRVFFVLRVGPHKWLVGTASYRTFPRPNSRPQEGVTFVYQECDFQPLVADVQMRSTLGRLFFWVQWWRSGRTLKRIFSFDFKSRQRAVKPPFDDPESTRGWVFKMPSWFMVEGQAPYVDHASSEPASVLPGLVAESVCWADFLARRRAAGEDQGVGRSVAWFDLPLTGDGELAPATSGFLASLLFAQWAWLSRSAAASSVKGLLWFLHESPSGSLDREARLFAGRHDYLSSLFSPSLASDRPRAPGVLALDSAAVVMPGLQTSAAIDGVEPLLDAAEIFQPSLGAPGLLADQPSRYGLSWYLSTDAPPEWLPKDPDDAAALAAMVPACLRDGARDLLDVRCPTWVLDHRTEATLEPRHLPLIARLLEQASAVQGLAVEREDLPTWQRLYDMARQREDQDDGVRTGLRAFFLRKIGRVSGWWEGAGWASSLEWLLENPGVEEILAALACTEGDQELAKLRGRLSERLVEQDAPWDQIWKMGAQDARLEALFRARGQRTGAPSDVVEGITKLVPLLAPTRGAEGPAYLNTVFDAAPWDGVPEGVLGLLERHCEATPCSGFASAVFGQMNRIWPGDMVRWVSQRFQDHPHLLPIWIQHLRPTDKSSLEDLSAELRARVQSFDQGALDEGRWATVLRRDYPLVRGFIEDVLDRRQEIRAEHTADLDRQHQERHQKLKERKLDLEEDYRKRQSELVEEHATVRQDMQQLHQGELKKLQSTLTEARDVSGGLAEAAEALAALRAHLGTLGQAQQTWQDSFQRWEAAVDDGRAVEDRRVETQQELARTFETYEVKRAAAQKAFFQRFAQFDQERLELEQELAEKVETLEKIRLQAQQELQERTAKMDAQREEARMELAAQATELQRARAEAERQLADKVEEYDARQLRAHHALGEKLEEYESELLRSQEALADRLEKINTSAGEAFTNLEGVRGQLGPIGEDVASLGQRMADPLDDLKKMRAEMEGQTEQLAVFADRAHKISTAMDAQEEKVTGRLEKMDAMLGRVAGRLDRTSKATEELFKDARKGKTSLEAVFKSVTTSGEESAEALKAFIGSAEDSLAVIDGVNLGLDKMSGQWDATIKRAAPFFGDLAHSEQQAENLMENMRQVRKDLSRATGQVEQVHGQVQALGDPKLLDSPVKTMDNVERRARGLKDAFDEAVAAGSDLEKMSGKAHELGQNLRAAGQAVTPTITAVEQARDRFRELAAAKDQCAASFVDVDELRQSLEKANNLASHTFSKLQNGLEDVSVLHMGLRDQARLLNEDIAKELGNFASAFQGTVTNAREDRERLLSDLHTVAQQAARIHERANNDAREGLKGTHDSLDLLWDKLEEVQDAVSELGAPTTGLDPRSELGKMRRLGLVCVALVICLLAGVWVDMRFLRGAPAGHAAASSAPAKDARIADGAAPRPDFTLKKKRDGGAPAPKKKGTR